MIDKKFNIGDHSMDPSDTAAVSRDTTDKIEELNTGGAAAASTTALRARLEPFDSYWQAPENVDAGYSSFYAYYKSNYLPYMPEDREAEILVVSCGPGYLVNTLKRHGYQNVTGIDSDADICAFDINHWQNSGRQVGDSYWPRWRTSATRRTVWSVIAQCRGRLTDMGLRDQRVSRGSKRILER